MGHDRAGLPATSKLTISEDDDLDEVWPKIIRACNEDYGWKLDGQGPTNVEDVLAVFKPVKKEKATIQDNAKAVFRQSLVVIERFGSIAAQGAGMVFGPANQCFNAVSFVINAVQDYHEAMGNVTTLMERVSTFLQTLQMYLDQKTVAGTEKLARPLRTSIYRVLQHFLTILGIWHKMAKKSGKVKLAMKVVVFGEDGGVKSAMSKLEQLVSDVTRTEIRSIVVKLSATAQNIDEMEKTLDRVGETVGRIEGVTVKTGEVVARIENASEKTVTSLGRLESAEDEKKRLNDIRDTLLSDSSQKRPWLERQVELWNKHIEGTSSWLIDDHKHFSRWVNLIEPAESMPLGGFSTLRHRTINVLCIKADEGFGKSYLCSAVIDHLQNKYNANQRVGVAYYYFQRESGKLPINTAFRSIIYQLASAANTSLGREYSQLIQRACDRKPDLARTTELWKQLVGDIAKTLDATFFIVLDGLDEVEVESGNPLASIIEEMLTADESRKLKIRLLLAGRSSGLDPVQDILRSHGKDPIPEIKLVPGGESPALTEADIMVYAEQRLNEMDIFKKDNKKVRDLKEMAKTALCKGARGDYVTLDYKLDNLSKCYDFPGVEKTLESAEESRKDIISGKIAKLNASLRIDEIREVNALLPWVAVAYADLSVGLCEAILSPLRNQTESLISLDKQLKTVYEDLFNVDKAGDVSLKNDEIAEHLRTYLSDTTDSTNDESAVGLNGSPNSSELSFEKSEIELVKKIIKTHFRNVFGSGELYDKFSFDMFLDSKLPAGHLAGDNRPRIRLGFSHESHALVARGCLAALSERNDAESPSDDGSAPSDQDKGAQSLFAYAAVHFASHLSGVVLDEVDAPTQQDITLKLIRTLREPEIINAWLDVKDAILEARYSLVHWTYTTKSMFEWLKDPVVQKGLRYHDVERDWVVDVTSGEGSPVRVLVEVAKQVAKRWVQMEKESWETSFLWLDDFLTNMGGTEPENFDLPSPSKIASMADWVKEKLGAVVEEAALHFCLAETLSYCEHPKDAFIRYQDAMKAAPQDWKYRFGYAKALALNKQANEAVEHVEKLIHDNEVRINSEGDDEFKTAYWDDMLPFLGQTLVDVKRFADAERTYWSILKEGYSRKNFMDAAKSAASGLMQAFHEQQKYDETIQLLRNLNERTHEQAELCNWLCAFLHHYANDNSVHFVIHAAACNGDDQIRTLMDLYRGAIEVARSVSSKFGTYLRLSYQLGRLLWSQGSREGQDAALSYWSDILEIELPDVVDKHDWSIRDARTETVNAMATALVTMAKIAGLSLPMNPTAEAYVRRLERLVSQDKAESITSLAGVSSAIPLARLHHLAGNEDAARNIARDHLKSVLLEVDFEGDRTWTFYRIVYILKAFDDDVNVLASYTVPEKIAPESFQPADHQTTVPVQDSVEAKEVPVTEIEGNTNPSLPVTFNAEKQASTGHEHVEDEEKNTVLEAKVPIVNGDSGDRPTGESATPPVDESERKPEGAVSRYCDGRECGNDWRYLGKMYSCKDCYDIQFEEQCYAKLKAGTLMTMCSSTHTHLEIPPFDAEMWKRTSKDQIVVGGKTITKREWVTRIKKEWNIMPTPKERFRWAVERVILYRQWRPSPPEPVPGVTRKKTIPFG